MNNNSQKYYKSMFKDYPDIVNVKQLQTMFGDIDGQTDFLLERLSTAVSGAYYFAPITVFRLRSTHSCAKV